MWFQQGILEKGASIWRRKPEGQGQYAELQES